LAKGLEDLLSAIIEWRNQKAIQIKVSPHMIFPDHLAMRIAYSKAKSIEALRESGIRINDIEELADLISSHLKASNDMESARDSEADEGNEHEDVMDLFFIEEVFTTKKSWKHAVYKAGRGGAMPKWEQSYERFKKGEHIEAIAMNQENGKPVQAQTIVGHILEALMHANKTVNLKLLVEYVGEKCLPNQKEWEAMEDAAAANTIDPVEQETFPMKEMMLTILGRPDIPPQDKAPKHVDEERAWYDKIRWWAAIKRAEVPFSFRKPKLDTPPTKKRRTSP